MKAQELVEICADDAQEAKGILTKDQFLSTMVELGAVIRAQATDKEVIDQLDEITGLWCEDQKGLKKPLEAKDFLMVMMELGCVFREMDKS